MPVFNRLTAICLAFTMLVPLAPVAARTKQGDRFLAQGRSQEAQKNWDEALELYEKALSEDPSEITYQMAVMKARFQSAQEHVNQATRLRSAGRLGEALVEYQKAYAINPASAVAVQEL